MNHQLCRGFTSHAFAPQGPRVLVGTNDVRISLYCPRCKSWASQVWLAGGLRIKPRSYKLHPLYAAFIHDHTPGEARVALLTTWVKQGSVKRETTDERNQASLRLVHSSRKTKTGRGRPQHAAKRRRAGAGA